VVIRWGDGSGCEEERLEPGWVWWIMGVLSLRLLLGRSMVKGGRSRGGRQRRWNFNGTSYGRWKRGMGGDGVRPFLVGRGDGGEAAPPSRRRMT
jgi:hypothetical protein